MLDNEKVRLNPLPSQQDVFGDFLKLLSKSNKTLASTKGLIICCAKDKTLELYICNPTTKV